jgi:hypothetical protein
VDVISDSSADNHISVLEFFADRGVFPADIPLVDVEAPLVDAAPEEHPSVAAGSEDPESVTQQIAKMGFTERLKAAMKGSREMRAVLIRDPNKMIAAAVHGGDVPKSAATEGPPRASAAL